MGINKSYYGVEFFPDIKSSATSNYVSEKNIKQKSKIKKTAMCKLGEKYENRLYYPGSIRETLCYLKRLETKASWTFNIQNAITKIDCTCS